MSVYKEKVVYGNPPAGMLNADDVAKILGIARKNVCGTMRKYGFEGNLFTAGSIKQRKAYYDRKDVEKVISEQHLKHNSSGPVIAFNSGVNNGKLFRFRNIWYFRRELKRKFGVSIEIRKCHEMLQNGTSFEGWFIDEIEEE